MPDPTVTMRVATASGRDVALVAPLFDAYRRFYGQPSDLALAARFIDARLRGRESVVLLAEVEAAEPPAALGFAQLYPSFSSVSAAPIWIVNDLFVVPTARGRGVGHRLLDAARAHAEHTGACRLVLSTARTNVGAQRLYESLGYERDDAFLHYTQELSRGA
jgi:ribosomal protein S18 acetylase RimI-like enzyme